MLTVQCCVWFLTLLLVTQVHSAKILGVFTIASVSHQIVYQPLWKELSLRGHQVTVLSPNPLNDRSLTNLTEIDLSFMYTFMEAMRGNMVKGMNHWRIMEGLGYAFPQISAQIFTIEEVLKFIKDDSQSFDVVLVEIMDPLTLTFAAKFKCPIIGISSMNLPNPILESVGSPMHVVLHPDVYTPYYRGELKFFEKVDAVLYDLYEKYTYQYVYFPAVRDIAKKHLGDDIPDLNSIQKNMSILLVNSNPIIHGVRPYGPNVVEIGGGIHIKPPKPLPLELKSFLDNANEGVVYFSLGSNVKSAFLPEDKRNVLVKTFAKLPYKVLWKFENDQLQEQPENVKIEKWLPQQDVLRHPNVKLFITQAGLQSTEEGLYNGVPFLAIPFLADQYVNAKTIQKLGVGLQVDFNSLTEENFLAAILEIVENPSYKKKAVDIGRLIKDQPMTGLEKAIWWTEYVIRNRGAPYLRNPRADVSWSEFLILDVFAFLFLILFITIFVICKISQYVFSHIFGREKIKKKSE